MTQFFIGMLCVIVGLWVSIVAVLAMASKRIADVSAENSTQVDGVWVEITLDQQVDLTELDTITIVIYKTGELAATSVKTWEEKAKEDQPFILHFEEAE